MLRLPLGGGPDNRGDACETLRSCAAVAYGKLCPFPRLGRRGRARKYSSSAERVIRSAKLPRTRSARI
jgi:hypothetical protein